jgi:hypothetical protein
MATIDLGKISFVWKGAYAGGTAYTIKDVVSYNGASYICKLASTGNLPTNATYWDLMSVAGVDGTDVGTTITTQGDILFRDGSGLQRLAKGSAADVLTMNAGATAPEWAASAGGGKVLQVTNDFITTSYHVTGTTETAFWTGANLTLADTSSKVLIMGTFSLGTDYGGTIKIQYSTDNASSWNDITTADMASTDGQQDSKAFLGIHHNPSTAGHSSFQTGINYLHSPSNTSARYRMLMAATFTNYDFSINRRAQDDDYGGFSFVTQMEIGA